ncbi:MAG: hypothetical protein JWN76_1892 [Chitinophagaceae bacterium]|nr:hypothetical protein [Chitinophagaceae bacterium]
MSIPMCLMLLANMPITVTMKVEAPAKTACCKKMAKTGMSCTMKMKKQGEQKGGCNNKENSTCTCIYCFPLLAITAVIIDNYSGPGFKNIFAFRASRYSGPYLDLTVPPPDYNTV